MARELKPRSLGVGVARCRPLPRALQAISRNQWASVQVKSMGKSLRKSPAIRLLTSTSCGDIFRFWTARQVRSHVRTNLAAERASRLATFSRQSLSVRHSA